MVFPKRVGSRPFPIKGCSGRALMRTAMRVHFCHRHVRDTVVILEEVNLPHPWCPLCDMLVMCKTLNLTHRCTAQCTRGAEQRRRQLAAEEEMEVTARDFSAYGNPLEMLTSFKYLGRVISSTDNNWPVVVRNLTWEKTVWMRMSQILSREGLTPRVSGFFLRP